MALPVAQPLSELTRLERSLLYVFLAGPGQGEGIAVALPGAGWLLIDNCRTADEALPLERLYLRFRDSGDDRVRLLLLTHPHRDHASGFNDLLDGCEPELVALTGLAPPEKTLELGEVAAHVCSPDADHLRAWLDDGTALDPRQANAISAVLRLAFGDSLVILGGDLPVSKGGSEVPTGWNSVMRRHPDLSGHQCLKVPHHGSREALHPVLLGAAPTADRAWMLTPFNSSGLPRPDDEDGLDVLLRSQSPVLLSARSLSSKFQAASAEGRVLRGELDRQTQSLKRDVRYREGDTVVTRSTARAALDPVWGVAMDRSGRVVGRWRGSAAVEVVSAAPG